MNPPLSNILKFSGASAVFGLFLFAVFQQTEFKDVIQAFGQARPLSIIGAGIAFMALVVFQAVRLHSLGRQYWRSYWDGLSTVCIGYFYNSLLPTNVGGDAYKVLRLVDRGTSRSFGLAVAVVDRLSGLITIMIAGIFSLTVFSTESIQFKTPDGRVVLWILIAFVLVTGIGTFALWKVPKLRTKARAIVDRFILAVRDLGRLRVAESLMWSGVVLAARVAKFWLLLTAFGGEPTIWLAITMVLAINLSGLLPVSLGGLGVQESVIFGFAILVGLDTASSASVALLNRVFVWAIGLLGGGLMLKTVLTHKKFQQS